MTPLPNTTTKSFKVKVLHFTKLDKTLQEKPVYI